MYSLVHLSRSNRRVRVGERQTLMRIARDGDGLVALLVLLDAWLETVERRKSRVRAALHLAAARDPRLPLFVVELAPLDRAAAGRGERAAWAT